MSISVGIAGAGLSGRLTALNCLDRGWKVTLFDRDDYLGHDSCGWVAAGMLAPYTELESSEPLLCRFGLDALKRWPGILEQLTAPVSFSQNGTLIVAHPQDKGERDRLMSIVDYKLRMADLPSLDSVAQAVSQSALNDFVPGISPELHDGFWIRGEGHINSHEFYRASAATLLKHKVTWHKLTPVEDLAGHEIVAAGTAHHFDLVFDCRGLGAKDHWSQLRGIRGEVLCVQTPEVTLSCPVRIMHPRYPIYISPRTDHVFVIGATSIESDDKSPISAQSMLELLSACYAVHPGFAEARIINTMTQCRPTLPDNHPKIKVSDGLVRINGLYRHGYMIGPVVVEEAINYAEHGLSAMNYPELVVEESVL